MKQFDIYETSALYTQNMDHQCQAALLKYYADIFSCCPSGKVHDCSIGAGGTTLPMAKLGYEVSGSDLNQNLLSKAKENFESTGFSIPLFQADFTRLDEYLNGEYDIIMSTGNSLPHVDTAGFTSFVQAVHKCLRTGGHLYFDMRNWDKILREKPLFIAGDPSVMTAEKHQSVYQIFQWNADNSVTFIFVTSVDENGVHVGEYALVAPKYYPLLKNDLESILHDNGFKLTSYYDMDALWNLNDSWHRDKSSTPGDTDFETLDWYGALFKKL
jgi:glycine/sarcosine N-methyltransferase